MVMVRLASQSATSRPRLPERRTLGLPMPPPQRLQRCYHSKPQREHRPHLLVLPLCPLLFRPPLEVALAVVELHPVMLPAEGHASVIVGLLSQAVPCRLVVGIGRWSLAADAALKRADESEVSL